MPICLQAQAPLRTDQPRIWPPLTHEVPSVFQVCQPPIQGSGLRSTAARRLCMSPHPSPRAWHSLVGSRRGWDEENMALQGRRLLHPSGCPSPDPSLRKGAAPLRPLDGSAQLPGLCLRWGGHSRREARRTPDSGVGRLVQTQIGITRGITPLFSGVASDHHSNALWGRERVCGLSIAV